MRLEQHKGFIYKGDDNLKLIRSDLSELLKIDYDDVMTSIPVINFDCRSLTVEDWPEIEKFYLFQSPGKNKVIVFHNAESLSINLQNKLLKPLEDSMFNTKTLFSTVKNLIDTIHSRAITINNYKSKGNVKFPENYSEFKEHFKNVDDEENIDDFLGNFYKGFIENESLLVSSGMIKEKCKFSKFYIKNIGTIARLVIMKELSDGTGTKRTMVARNYLEVEESEHNLVILLLELEL